MLIDLGKGSKIRLIIFADFLNQATLHITSTHLASHWFEDNEPEHYLLKAPRSPIPTHIKLNFAYHVSI